MNKINISFTTFTLKQLQITGIIKQCIQEVLKQEKVPVDCEVNVLVTNNEGIRAINNASRSIDKATDVLSFPMFQFEAGDYPADWSEFMDPETDLCPLGDMAISLERAVAQAKEFGHSTRREIGYLTIHSMLHLLGYDHLDEGPQKEKMRTREELIAGNLPGMKRN